MSNPPTNLKVAGPPSYNTAYVGDLSVQKTRYQSGNIRQPA
ncbi:hypothetical protein [Rubripirellula reticaptiva]|nr:hypothetical protein [Rubripirellula reticaptiva]